MRMCVSCGMPLDECATSKYDMDFCIYCQNQETKKKLDYEQVRCGCIAAAQRFMNLTEEEAVKKTDEMLPNLPRWKEDKKTNG